MTMRGGDIVVRALEDEGVRYTFGIPGTHNIELYDSLERSEKITPILVTDEQSASFMADGVSRTSDTIGVANVVPGAGVTHCLSGVGEAFMDGIPILVLTCGIRIDTGKAFQLHDVDQLGILKPLTKCTFKPEKVEDIYPTLRRAIRLARAGTPGPVAVEIPANLYIVGHSATHLELDEPEPSAPYASEADLDRVAEMLNGAQHPIIYAGYGVRETPKLLREVAERLNAPVATTIQGKGVLPESHPLWLWCGLGGSTPPFARRIAERADVMLAIGCRFGEVATASYGLTVPGQLIHVDINEEVIGRNYPATMGIVSDAHLFLDGLRERLKERPRDEEQATIIAEGHREVMEDWRTDRSRSRVTPAALFEALQQRAKPDAIYATDSGNGTFLAMEHLRLEEPDCFIGPVDYSCMGYCVPAAIGAKLANPDRDVVALAGDGALLMTGLELLTASTLGIAPLVCVLRDRELGQIAQFQRTSLDRDTCSILPDYELRDLAAFTHCEFLEIGNDSELDRLDGAFETARAGKPILVDVAIDYSRKTYFTKGVVATNFWRLPWAERIRMAGRAVGRKLLG